MDGWVVGPFSGESPWSSHPLTPENRSSSKAVLDHQLNDLRMLEFDNYLTLPFVFLSFFLIKKIISRERRPMCGCFSHTHTPLPRGPGPQPRHRPWLGIKPVVLWFKARCSIHWATPARACFPSWKTKPIHNKTTQNLSGKKKQNPKPQTTTITAYWQREIPQTTITTKIIPWDKIPPLTSLCKDLRDYSVRLHTENVLAQRNGRFSCFRCAF